MALQNKLETIKSNLDSLLVYANGVTGEEDTKIGDAVRTLAEGFGSGVGNNKWTKLCDLTGDKNLRQVLTDTPIPCGNNNNFIAILLHTGNNACSTGITYFSAFIVADGIARTMANAYSNTTGLTPVFNDAIETNINGANNNYYSYSNHQIKASGSTDTSRVYPAGNSLYYTIIPMDFGGALFGLSDDTNNIDSDIKFKYTGKNPTLIASHSETYTLDDTSFVVGSTVGTTATIIKEYGSKEFDTGNYNFGDKDIVIVQKGYIQPTYNSDATNISRQTAFTYQSVVTYTRSKSTVTGVKDYRKSTNYYYFCQSYYSTQGSYDISYSSYGIYMDCAQPQIDSPWQDTTKITVNSPRFSCRSHSSYSSQDNMSKITGCSFKWVVEAYVVDPQTTLYSTLISDVENNLINGI